MVFFISFLATITSMWIGSLRLSFGRPIGGPFPINERPNNRQEKTNNLESSRSTTAMATVVSTIETTRSFSLCEWMSQIALGLKMFTPFTAQIGSTATIAIATALPTNDDSPHHTTKERGGCRPDVYRSKVAPHHEHGRSINFPFHH